MKIALIIPRNGSEKEASFYDLKFVSSFLFSRRYFSYLLSLPEPPSPRRDGSEIFFFQAEDGKRDVAVTRVQTCALPISAPVQDASCCSGASAFDMDGDGAVEVRAEGRRGGEGGRSRWSPDHLKKHT